MGLFPEQLLYTAGGVSKGVVLDETSVENAPKRRHKRRRVDILRIGRGKEILRGTSDDENRDLYFLPFRLPWFVVTCWERYLRKTET